jgi:hypothetical protein
VSASLRYQCATAPLAIRRPAAGTPLLAVCEAAEAEPLPKDLDGAWSEAREAIDRRTDLPPLAAELAHGADVMRRAKELLALRHKRQEKRNNPDRHEGFAVPVTVCLFLHCGGRFAPGDHADAYQRAAEYLGVAPSDVAGAVSHYMVGTYNLTRNAACGRWGVRPAELFSAALQATSELVVRYWHLLDHTHANARLAAEIATSPAVQHQALADLA